MGEIDYKKLVKRQVARLDESHFLILYWAVLAREKRVYYNVTNVFDDLKFHNLTRTKQNAVSYLESLEVLSFIELSFKSNKRNILIMDEGLEVLEILVKSENFKIKKSNYLGG